MPRRIAHAAFATAAAVLLAACAATPALPPDPYANCLDLGDLSLSSSSRADAESLMRARVRELGGDTLIFGERGRPGRAGNTPEEVARRRSALLGAEVGGDSRPQIAGALQKTDEPQSPAASEGAGSQRRGRVTAQPVEPLVGELWYYGAALRCNREGSAVLAQADAAPTPLVRIAPDYPREATVGAGGEVSLEFTIATTGTTKDIVVVAASAPELEGPAVAALLRWRYAPRIENGAPVELRGVRTTIHFERKRDPA
jgi:TonB family protein